MKRWRLECAECGRGAYDDDLALVVSWAEAHAAVSHSEAVEA